MALVGRRGNGDTYIYIYIYINLTYSRWASSLPYPACGHKGSSHLSQVHALQIFYRDASSAFFLQLVNQWLNLTYSRSQAFRYERKNTNPTLVRIELMTSALLAGRWCADYLLDHSGDEPLLVEPHNVLSRFGSLLAWVAGCHHDVTRWPSYIFVTTRSGIGIW